MATTSGWLRSGGGGDDAAVLVFVSVMGSARHLTNIHGTMTAPQRFLRHQTDRKIMI